MDRGDFDTVIREAERLVLERLAPEDRAWAIDLLMDAGWQSDRTALPIEAVARQDRS